MGSNLYHKKYIEKLIATNPADITINRKTEIDDGYGGYTEKESIHDEVVTFYQKKSNRQTVSESGISTGFLSTTVDKILASGDADILEGDTFKANGREYRVLLVNSYFDICKQIELEVIKNEL